MQPKALSIGDITHLFIEWNTRYQFFAIFSKTQKVGNSMFDSKVLNCEYTFLYKFMFDSKVLNCEYTFVYKFNYKFKKFAFIVELSYASFFLFLFL